MGQRLEIESVRDLATSLDRKVRWEHWLSAGVYGLIGGLGLVVVCYETSLDSWIGHGIGLGLVVVGPVTLVTIILNRRRDKKLLADLRILLDWFAESERRLG